MAQFRGTIRGNRGITSRLGTRKGGLFVTADGWHIGATVHLDHIDGKDVVTVILTGGSEGEFPDGHRRQIGRFVEGEPIK